MTIDIPNLREKAVAATPGPWEAWKHPESNGYWYVDRTARIEAKSAFGDIATCSTGIEETAKANAAFIAASNPAAVIALCDRIAELENALEQYADESLWESGSLNEQLAQEVLGEKQCGEG